MPASTESNRLRAASGSSVSGPGDEEIVASLQSLETLELPSLASFEEILVQTSILPQLRYILKEHGPDDKSQDTFRRSHGFEIILRLLDRLSIISQTLARDREAKNVLHLLLQFLMILEAALEDHPGNNRFFRHRVEKGGWVRVQGSLTAVLAALIKLDNNQSQMEQFFGLLLASAIGNEAASDVYITAAGRAKPGDSLTQVTLEAQIRDRLEKATSEVHTIALPDMLSIAALLWTQCLADFDRPAALSLAIPLSMEIILSRSKECLVVANAAQLFTPVKIALLNSKFSHEERECFRRVAVLLVQEGVSDLQDAHDIFARSASDVDTAKLLLEAIRTSRQPPTIQFDLSKHGSSSVELANLRRPFPASNADSNGYSLALWARFDRFDHGAHTTLFGAFDKTQTCFVLAYLEKDTKNLILQTSIRGTKPSVRFKSVVFETQQWYHICVTHRRPKVTSASKASLFVNGEFVEQAKSTFPSPAPVDRATNTIRVQAFLGTPQDLMPDTGRRACLSQWSLASAVLYDDVLSDDLVAVMHHLGPRYYGNLQDCLGSFQTYRASAELNLRNESLNPGKEEHSDLIMAIRHKASDLIHESKFLLNISPAAVFDGDDRNNIDESQLIKSLSRVAAKNLIAYTRAGANAIAVNGAVPAINDALVQTNGVAMLMGEPIVIVPQALDDVSFRLGGCSIVGLALVHRARTTEDVVTAVDIVLESIRDSWRNSEAMERDSGYGILCNLIREKLSPHVDITKNSTAIPTPKLDRNGMAVRILRSILAFVGYNPEDEQASIIINPLAYKILLVDTNIWRTHSYETQELFFKQITVFAVSSLHARFNIKRLNRMRALRTLIEALKGESVSRRIMPFYAATLKALLPHATSAEMLRSVALFITFSVHKRSASSRSRKHLISEPRSRGSSGSAPSSPPITAPPEAQSLTQFDIGLEVLRLYSDLLCTRGDTSMIKKFAKTVTNKWLLYLLSESSPEVVVTSVRILARLLVVHREAYIKKFKERSGGFVIMCHRLKRWWHLPALWPLLFAILFGVDVADLDLDRSFDLFSFIELFDSKEAYRVIYPEVFEVIMGMLQSGLRSISSARDSRSTEKLATASDTAGDQRPQRLSMSSMAPTNPHLALVTVQNIDTFNTIIRFLADLQTRSARFRSYATSSTYVQDLLCVLFPVVVGSDIVEASVELDARDSVLSFDGTDMVIQPFTKSPVLMRSSSSETVTLPSRGKGLRRGSSFVLVRGEQTRPSLSASTSQVPSAPRKQSLTQAISDTENNAAVQDTLDVIISGFIEQILGKREFTGLGLFLKTPPGFVEYQHYFSSWILRNTVSQLSNFIALNQAVLCEPRALTNLAKFFSHMGEALFEGWFIGGAECVLDLAGSVLEYLQRPDIGQMKSVRLCAQPVSQIRVIVFRTVLLNLSDKAEADSLKFLAKLAYWQNVLLSSEESQTYYLQHVCYLLYGDLTSSDEDVRMAAANLWRIILVQKPEEAALVLGQANTVQQKRLVSSFEKLVELDNETFLVWVDEHRIELDDLFSRTLAQSWESFVAEENKRTEDAARSRINRRREKLKVLAREEAEREEFIRRHEVTFDHWTSNIYSSENLKHKRLMQDQYDDTSYTETVFRRKQRELSRSTGLFLEEAPLKWRLDQTEGRNRMRMRLVEDFTKETQVREPKRKGSDIPALRLDTKGLRNASSDSTPMVSAIEPPSASSPRQFESMTEPFPEVREEADGDDIAEIEDSFELIEDPNAGDEAFEDKNRKVMRSLQHGDQVKHVANVSRIIGLEAVEGLLILGKDHIYLIDNFFARADGEIVNVWQAPQEERDPYTRVISGKDVAARRPQARSEEHEARSWKWSEIISVSKRRFLFRDVAIEIFFGDGRSYLLTMLSTQSRNDLHGRINGKAPQYGNTDSPQSEFAWRYATLKSPEEESQTLSARFTNVFGQSPVLAATRKWQKGEMSNFHYLMLLNTMAGRTYNDLTQYPVFPWVIADYTSEELDLGNPKTFRDLSKPMGCQTAEREAEFRERFKSFAEMGDHNAPPFHYGTHYSSAMIVTSYLIRLQPFVKSFLLLQGGTFDHADRMFFSIEQAWRSASRVNMTDVRELTPEFFYLPEFLTNPNGYDFGTRQNSNSSIGEVELPPWAKGDPRIFITKQREALESPYVSLNLHRWIDLVFGFKQKGDAAVDACNMFHHLSYQGAKDLDAMEDSDERLATIGIIHNFGQTPYQIFPKAHPAREHTRHKYKRIDTAAESLTRLPSTLLDSEESVASLTYSWKTDRLLCSGAFRLNIPPNYEKYMEWGFFDGSIRFYSADTGKQIGLFEHLHIGQMSCAIFADSKTLVTAGVDCTIAVWSVVTSGKTIDLQPRATLFGHHQPVRTLALSRSFNALLSVSSSGELMLWDLNRCEFVRRITADGSFQPQCAAINDVTGNIVLCHGSHVSIYTLNGELLLRQDTSDRASMDDNIVSVACYEGAGNEWLERDILFTGHKKGVVKVWSKIVNPAAGSEGEFPFELELIRQLNHVDPTRDDGGNVAAGITCMLVMPQVVYTGDEEGRVCEWNCVQRH